MKSRYIITIKPVANPEFTNGPGGYPKSLPPAILLIKTDGHQFFFMTYDTF